jgi:hypothetical protein
MAETATTICLFIPLADHDRKYFSLYEQCCQYLHNEIAHLLLKALSLVLRL